MPDQVQDAPLKRVVLGAAGSFFVLMLVQIGGLVWWASAINSGLTSTRESMTELKASVKELQGQFMGYTNISIRVATLEASAADRELRIRDLEKRKP